MLFYAFVNHDAAKISAFSSFAAICFYYFDILFTVMRVLCCNMAPLPRFFWGI